MGGAFAHIIRISPSEVVRRIGCASAGRALPCSSSEYRPQKYKTYSERSYTRTTNFRRRNHAPEHALTYSKRRRNRRRPGECRAELPKYAAARPLFALRAGRMAGCPLKSWGPSGGNDFWGNPQEGVIVFPGLGAVCPIEGVWVRTKIIRSALRSNGRFIPANRGTGLNPKKCPRLCLRYFVGTPGSSERVSASSTVPVGSTELGVFVPA